MITETNLKTALLGSGAALALLAGPAMADEVTDLKSQIDALQSRLDQLETQQKKASSERVAPAQAVTGGEFPGSWKLPGSDTSISFSGYIKADAYYTINRPNFNDSFTVTGIAVDTAAARNQGGEFRMHARQSRIRFDSRTPTEWGSLRTRLEGDFQVLGGGNERFSNSNGFRLRHAWGSLGPVMAGQNWTTFQDQDTFFDTVDFAGPSGVESIRQAQIRYTASLHKEVSMDVAIENPEQINRRNVAGAVAANGNFQDKLPDFVAALRWRPSWGAVNVSGVARYFNYDDGAGSQDNAVGGGGHLGVTLKTWGKDTLGFIANYGYGMGRYIGANQPAYDYFVSRADVSGCAGGHAMVVGCGAEIHLTPSYGFTLGYQRFWTDTLRSTLAVGMGGSKVDTALLGPAARGLPEHARTVHANLMWSPVSRVTIGAEIMWGWIYHAKVAGGMVDGDGQAGRLQLGMQYNF